MKDQPNIFEKKKKIKHKMKRQQISQKLVYENFMQAKLPP